MDDQWLRAKQLFTSFHGSTFQMYREGVLEEYKKYDISPQMELDWFKEQIAGYCQELSIRDWSAVTGLGAVASQYKDKTILENVEAFTSRHLMSADSIVKLMYAEGIIDIVKKIKEVVPKELLYKAYKTTAIILDDVISKPLIIDPGHELHNYNLNDKRSLNHRAQRSIDAIKDDLVTK